MKTLKLVSVFVLLLQMINCNAQSDKKQAKTSVNTQSIEVYYFHFTARCHTCRTVEAKAKESVETLYSDFVQKGRISFQSVNLDDESGKDLAKKLNVYGQTLLIVKGETKINITNEGFMYANSDSDKFKAIIKEKIDALL